MRVDWLHRCGHTAACKSFDLGLVSYRPLAGVLYVYGLAREKRQGPQAASCKQATVLEALATVEEAEVVVVHVQSRVGMRTTKASLAMRPLAALAGASALAYVLLFPRRPRRCSRRRRCAAPRNPPDSRSACAGARGAAERHQRARRAGRPEARRCRLLRRAPSARTRSGRRRRRVPARGHGPGEPRGCAPRRRVRRGGAVGRGGRAAVGLLARARQGRCSTSAASRSIPSRAGAAPPPPPPPPADTGVTCRFQANQDVAGADLMNEPALVDATPEQCPPQHRTGRLRRGRHPAPAQPPAAAGSR